MHSIRVAALVAAACLCASAARSADFSVSLSDGASPVRHVVLQQPAQGGRTSLFIVSADAAGSPSAWCTFRSGIVPGPGVAGSFEIAAGAPGYNQQLPATIPQDQLACAPLANQTSNLTVVANQ